VNPYPLYDRWGDSFNLQTEFVAVNQARALAAAAYLMAKTSLATQAWQCATARIVGLGTGNASRSRAESAQTRNTKVVFAATKHESNEEVLTIEVPGCDLSKARIVWEAEKQEPVFGPNFLLKKGSPAPQWIEAEAQWPDGRRAFGVVNSGR